MAAPHCEALNLDTLLEILSLNLNSQNRGVKKPSKKKRSDYAKKLLTQVPREHITKIVRGTDGRGLKWDLEFTPRGFRQALGALSFDACRQINTFYLECAEAVMAHIAISRARLERNHQAHITRRDAQLVNFCERHDIDYKRLMRAYNKCRRGRMQIQDLYYQLYSSGCGIRGTDDYRVGIHEERAQEACNIINRFMEEVETYRMNRYLR